MRKSLQAITQEYQPQSTEATIRQASKSSYKNDKVWIVAEGDDDAELYGKMYDDDSVRSLPSTDSKGNKSCKNVETIVSNILSNSSIKIIGIRDKDYTAFTNYTKPHNIFLTDQRDIEMQIIKSKKSNITPHINQSSWNDVFSYAKQIGYYRIFNDKENLGFCFNNINANDYWDFTHKKLLPGWSTQLENFFFNHISSAYTVSQLKQKYTALTTQIARINSVSDFDICQGHEVVNLLKRTGNNNLNNLDSDLFKWYMKSDFQQSNLAGDIANFASTHAWLM